MSLRRKIALWLCPELGELEVRTTPVTAQCGGSMLVMGGATAEAVLPIAYFECEQTLSVQTARQNQHRESFGAQGI